MRINLISYKELIIPTTATATTTKPIQFFIAYNNKIKNIYIYIFSVMEKERHEQPTIQHRLIS
jgi:hypothetical protein